jgi:4'-phosphopantetheinyl transferase EntD
VWPDGVVGSITHKGRYRAAAVARASELAGLGIDAELDEPLPAGVLETIASPRELEEVQRLLAERPGLAWDRLLFSAKEAAVKATQPLLAGAAGVRAVEVRLDAAGSYSATLAGSRGDLRDAIEGEWIGAHRLLLTVASFTEAPA